MNLEQKYVEMDELSGVEGKFLAWVDMDNQFWNGWVRPLFEESDRKNVIAQFICALGAASDEVQDLLNIPPEMIDGKKLYNFGGWLIWNYSTKE